MFPKGSGILTTTTKKKQGFSKQLEKRGEENVHAKVKRLVNIFNKVDLIGMRWVSIEERDWSSQQKTDPQGLLRHADESTLDSEQQTATEVFELECDVFTYLRRHFKNSAQCRGQEGDPGANQQAVAVTLQNDTMKSSHLGVSLTPGLLGGQFQAFGCLCPLITPTLTTDNWELLNDEETHQQSLWYFETIVRVIGDFKQISQKIQATGQRKEKNAYHL